MKVSYTLVVLMSACISLASSGPLLDLFKRFAFFGRNLGKYDAVYNIGPWFRPSLRAGVSTSDPGVTVEEEFTGMRFGCRKQGVLKITLSNSTVDNSRSRVLIDLVLSRPRDFVFNIGDSRTNDGEGDDAMTQDHDAQVVGGGRTFKVFLSDASGGGNPVDIDNLYKSRITIAIGDGELIWSADHSKKLNYLINPGLFALNDQSDSVGEENFDIYLGINRAIAEGTTNRGSGVCSVGVRYLPVIE